PMVHLAAVIARYIASGGIRQVAQVQAAVKYAGKAKDWNEAELKEASGYGSNVGPNEVKQVVAAGLKEVSDSKLWFVCAFSHVLTCTGVLAERGDAPHGAVPQCSQADGSCPRSPNPEMGRGRRHEGGSGRGAAQGARSKDRRG